MPMSSHLSGGDLKISVRHGPRCSAHLRAPRRPRRRCISSCLARFCDSNARTCVSASTTQRVTFFSSRLCAFVRLLGMKLGFRLGGFLCPARPAARTGTGNVRTVWKSIVTGTRRLSKGERKNRRPSLALCDARGAGRV